MHVSTTIQLANQWTPDLIDPELTCTCHYDAARVLTVLKGLDETMEGGFIEYLWRNVQDLPGFDMPLTLHGQLMRVTNAKKLAEPDEILEKLPAVFKAFSTSDTSATAQRKPHYLLLLLEPQASEAELAQLAREVQLHASTFKLEGLMQLAFKKVPPT